MTSPDIYGLAKSLGLRVVPNTGIRRAGVPPLPVELEAGGVVVATYNPVSGVLAIPGVAAWLDTSRRDERDVLGLLAAAAVAGILRPWPEQHPARAALLEVLDRCLGRIPRLPVDPL